MTAPIIVWQHGGDARVLLSDAAQIKRGDRLTRNGELIHTIALTSDKIVLTLSHSMTKIELPLQEPVHVWRAA